LIYAVISGLGIMGTFIGTFVTGLAQNLKELFSTKKGIALLISNPSGTLNLAGGKAALDAKNEALEYAGKKHDAEDAFEARMKAIKDSLEHPKPPDFSKEEHKAAAKGRREKAIDSDSLTKVGNFLGTSKNAISGSQQQMAMHAEQTATNTGKMLDVLNKILDKSGTQPTSGQGEQTHFPVN